MATKTLPDERKKKLLEILQKRFEQNPHLHRGIGWESVQARLEMHPQKLYVLDQMEITDGEPDVIGIDESTGEILFADCAPESPKGRRSVCFDQAALESRKEHKPKNSALGMASQMGVRMLTEAQYRHLQQLFAFDLKTSSWIQTPENIRKRGGALFCDRRYDHVFTYHNGAESYYAARGFRGILAV